MNRFILSIFLAGSLFCEEDLKPLIPNEDLSIKTQPVTYESVVFFGSLSLVSGGGVSYRNRTGALGYTIDGKVGVFRSSPMVLGEANFLWYPDEDSELSPYLSMGMGGVYGVIPYAPFRLGVESKRGFVDVGANIRLFPRELGLSVLFPTLEIRAGLNSKF